MRRAAPVNPGEAGEGAAKIGRRMRCMRWMRPRRVARMNQGEAGARARLRDMTVCGCGHCAGAARINQGGRGEGTEELGALYAVTCRAARMNPGGQGRERGGPERAIRGGAGVCQGNTRPRG